MLRALIWDVDGTIAETERDGHRVAFNLAFADAGLPWHWGVAEYGPLLRVAGGLERLQHAMVRLPGAPAETPDRDAMALRLHQAKNLAYRQIVAEGRLQARPGVLRLAQEAHAAGVRQAVCTTTSRANVQALFSRLWGPGWDLLFPVVVGAEDAPLKKPHPQAYRLALQRLGVAADEAFALEDSPNGLQAARGAGIACGITRSEYFADAAFPGAAWVRDDLEAPPAVGLRLLESALSGSIG